MDIWSLSLQVH